MLPYIRARISLISEYRIVCVIDLLFGIFQLCFAFMHKRRNVVVYGKLKIIPAG